jgi:hypothetical protein
MSGKSKQEYFSEIREKYLQSSKETIQKVLDEFCNVCSHNRIYATRLLNKKSTSDKKKKRQKPGAKSKYNTPLIILFDQFFHSKPMTLFERLCKTNYIDDESKLEYKKISMKPNPFELQRRIKEKLQMIHR